MALSRSLHHHRIIHLQPVHAEIAWGHRDDVLELAVVGELCTWSTEMFRSAVFDLIADHAPSRVHLDLSEVTFIDARGVAMLLAVRELVERSGGALATSWSDAVVRVLTLCGLDRDVLDRDVRTHEASRRTSV